MSVFLELRERLNAIRLRGMVPLTLEIDHEDFYRLWQAFRERSWYMTGAATYEELPAHHGGFTTVLFEGVRIINKG